MATTTGKARCITCGKERRAVKCEGCRQMYCPNHLNDHYKVLSQQLDEIEVHRDVFRQKLTQHTTNPQKHPLIKQIDQWERDSISKIQQTAQESRQILLQHTTAHTHQTETDLTKLTDKIRKTRRDNDFNEIDLNDFRQKLAQFEKELDQPSNIYLQQHSETLVNKISVVISKGKYVKLIDSGERTYFQSVTNNEYVS